MKIVHSKNVDIWKLFIFKKFSFFEWFRFLKLFIYENILDLQKIIFLIGYEKTEYKKVNILKVWKERKKSMKKIKKKLKLKQTKMKTGKRKRKEAQNWKWEKEFETGWPIWYACAGEAELRLARREK